MSHTFENSLVLRESAVGSVEQTAEETPIQTRIVLTASNLSGKSRVAQINGSRPKMLLHADSLTMTASEYVPEQLRPQYPRITDKQKHTLQFIYAYFDKHRHYPTLKEINTEMKVSNPSSPVFVAPLVKKGYLTKVGYGGTNLRITQRGLEMLAIMGVIVEPVQSDMFPGEPKKTND